MQSQVPIVSTALRPITFPPRPAPAAPVAAAADRRWDPLIVCLALYIVTAVGRLHQLVGALDSLHLPLLAAGGAIALYLASRTRSRRLAPVLGERITPCVLALAAWMACSVPFALWPGGALHEWTGEFLKACIMFVILAGAVRGVRDVERLALAYFIGVAVYSAVVLSRFQLTSTDWRLASLYDYDANEFATLIAMCLPLAVYFAFRPGPFWRRAAALGGGAVLAIAFIWAGSRGGFLALLAVGAYLLLRYRGMRIGLRIGATALVALVFAATASNSFWEKMNTILSPGTDYNVTAESGRVQVWKRGIGYMLSHPVLGVGAGNFPVAEGTISPLLREVEGDRGLKWSVAHNSYLQVGAELGVPGLVIFLLMLARAFRSLGQVAGRAPPGTAPAAGPLAQALTAALIGYVVGAFFLSLAYRDLLYVLLALAAGLHKGVIRRPALVGWRR